MAKTKAITFKVFRARYNIEDSYRTEIFKLRFPDGFICSVCECREYYPIRRRGTYQCRAYRQVKSKIVLALSKAASGVALFAQINVVDNIQS